jgi:STE24 endopeptidase
MLGSSAVVFVVLAAVLVPWSWVPGGHVVHVPSSEVFTAEQLRRGHTYSTMQRHLGWASLAVSLVVTLVLGLTRVGSRLVRLLPGCWRRSCSCCSANSSRSP